MACASGVVSIQFEADHPSGALPAPFPGSKSRPAPSVGPDPGGTGVRSRRPRHGRMHRYPLGGRRHGRPRLLGDSEEDEGEKHQGDEKRPDDPLAVSRSPFPDLLVHDDPPSLPGVRRRLAGNSSRNRRVIPSRRRCRSAGALLRSLFQRPQRHGAKAGSLP